MGGVVLRHDSVIELVAETRIWLVGMAVAAASLRLLGCSNTIRNRLVTLSKLTSHRSRLCCLLVPRINRPYFEDAASDLMRRPDFADLQKYYARSPSSGIFILEYGTKFIGLVAIDASKDSQSEESLTKKNNLGLADKPKGFYSSGTSSVATIRHFHVEEQFRKSNVQQDILAFAARHVFTTAQSVKVLKASTTTLLDYKYNSLRELGFSMEKQTGKLGIVGWRLNTMSLERTRWEKEQSKESSEST